MRTSLSACSCLPTLVLLLSGCGGPVLTNGGPSTPVAAPANPTPSPALLVVNKYKGTSRPSELAIVEPSTGRVVARIPTGFESHEVVASPDGKLAVVSNTGPYSDPGHTLSIIDLKGQREIKRVDLGPLTSPHGLAWHEGKVYFTAEGAKIVGRYDLAKGTVDWMYGVGQDSIHMLVFAADGQRFFTADRGSAAVSVIPLKSPPHQVVPGGPAGMAAPTAPPPKERPSLIPVRARPEGIDITPDGAQVWVGCDGAVTIIDTATQQVAGTIELAGGGVNRVKISPDGKLAVATQWNAQIAILDVATRKEIKRIDTGAPGTSVVFTPDGSHAYVNMTDKNEIVVLDMATLAITARIGSSVGPDGMAWVR